MAEIRLERVSKVFDGGLVAVNDLSLTVADGEFLVLVGPSGCGKSTRCASSPGSRSRQSATSSSASAEITDLEPKRRDFAMVFQNYALYPHMTVEKNLGFGLKLRRVSKAESRAAGCRDEPDPRPRGPARPQARRSSRAASASASRWAARSSASRRRS